MVYFVVLGAAFILRSVSGAADELEKGVFLHRARGPFRLLEIPRIFPWRW